MDLKEIGKQLRAARLAAGLTMRELAARAGVSHQLVEKVEAGQRNTTLRTLAKMTGAAGADLVVEISGGSARVPVSTVTDRLALAARFLAVLPRLPDGHVDTLLHEIALWETKYAPDIVQDRSGGVG